MNEQIHTGEIIGPIQWNPQVQKETFHYFYGNLATCLAFLFQKWRTWDFDSEPPPLAPPYLVLFYFAFWIFHYWFLPCVLYLGWFCYCCKVLFWSLYIRQHKNWITIEFFSFRNFFKFTPYFIILLQYFFIFNQKRKSLSIIKIF